MLHVPKVVQVPHALNGLHSEERKRFKFDGVGMTDSRAHTHHFRVLTLVNCLVVVAGLVRDAMFVCVLPHPSMVSSMTGAGVSAVDHVLDGNVSRWPRTSPLYVDTVCTRQRKISHKSNISFGKAQLIWFKNCQGFQSVWQDLSCIQLLKKKKIPSTAMTRSTR